ncbi:MAG: hypothetical protein ACI4M9_04775, partial [Succinivibrio sp.]
MNREPTIHFLNTRSLLFHLCIIVLTVPAIIFFSVCSNTGNSFDDTLLSHTESASLIKGKSPE